MDALKPNILILEDHDAVRLLLSNTLLKHYHVVAKKDGMEGMAYLTAGNLPDLIVLDVEMPRLNGMEFLTQVKSSGVFRNIPVVLISANDNEDDIFQFFRMGIWAFIQKPFDPTALYDKIADILKKTSQEAIVF